MKKFLTVLLVIAVMFTFSFSSAFAVTNFNGQEYPAMQAGDYYVGGSVVKGTAGAMGITDAERDAYVALLEKALKTLDDDSTYASKEYCGNHLTNVTNYVKEALEAAKVATTSTGLKQIKDTLATKVGTAKTKAQLIAALEAADQYNTGAADAEYKITLRLAAGTYLLPGYGYFTTDANNVVVIAEDGSNKIDTKKPALDWMLDNGYETKTQIESTAAQAALEKAVVKVSANVDGKTVYIADVANLTPEFVAAYYEWQGYVTKLAQTVITDLEATVAVEDQMAAFEDKYLDAPDSAYGTVLTNKAGRDAKVAAAYKYYTSVNFDKEYDAIKDLKSTEYVANKDKIVKLAQAIVAYEDKYDVTTTYNLAAELTAIEDAGDDAFKKAELPLASLAAESVLASQKEAVEAYASAYDAYKAEFKDAIYAGFGGTTAVATDIAVATEAKILALKANLGQLKEDAEDADAKLQAYLNNATLKVTTTALGNNKIRVQAKFDAETYKDIVGQMKDGYTISYKFYHKTAAATTYKAAKEKDRNYITYTKKSLKKGVKYKFRCAVVIKDKAGNVVATKDYKASTIGSRVCK